MGSTATQLQTIQELASMLYPILPYSSNPMWKGHISYQTLARKHGVAAYWTEGSKMPGLTNLLQQIYDRDKNAFVALIRDAFIHGLQYRAKQGQEMRIAPEELDAINHCLLGLGIKVEDLCDPSFRAKVHAQKLGVRAEAVSPAHSPIVHNSHAAKMSKVVKKQVLYDRFMQLCAEPNRQKAGLQFESVLQELFEVDDLQPTEPFHLIGEQIDGAIEHGGHSYLIEAKWEKTKIGSAEMYILKGKVEGKSRFTRGIMIALNGVTDDGIAALRTNKVQGIFCLDGRHIMRALRGESLKDIIESQRKRLDVMGIPYL